MFEPHPLTILAEEFTPIHLALAGIERRYLLDEKINPEEFRHYAAIETPNTRVGYFLPANQFKAEVDSTVKKLKKLGSSELHLIKRIASQSDRGLSLTEPLSLFPTNNLFAKVEDFYHLKPMVRVVLGFQPHVTDPRDIGNPFSLPPFEHREQGSIKCDLDECINQFKLHLEYRYLLDGPFTRREVEAIKRALDVACSAHSNDYRKNGEPYAIHPIECATMLLKLPSAQAPWIIACLLHDVGEDTDFFGPIKPGARGFEESVRYKLFIEFGECLPLESIDSIAISFFAITRSYVDNKEDKPTARKESFEKAIKDPGASFIKLIDRLHNTETIDVRRPEKILETTSETKTYLLKWPKNVRRDYHILAATLRHETELAIDLALGRLLRNSRPR